jgi:hypothetical protein
MARDRDAVSRLSRKCLRHRHFFDAAKIAVRTRERSGFARNARADQRNGARIVRHGASSLSTIR